MGECVCRARWTAVVRVVRGAWPPHCFPSLKHGAVVPSLKKIPSLKHGAVVSKLKTRCGGPKLKKADAEVV